MSTALDHAAPAAWQQTPDPRERFAILQEHLNGRVLGQPELIERMLVCLLADGHMLVEGAPGLAKTTAVKALAEAIDAKDHRIQFTPDLLPGDVTGTDVFEPETSRFRFEPGPVFHNLVLADEINRAPAKVQSALLEAMGERQVTVGSKSYPLPELFLVMATQNPIEQEGTYEEALISGFSDSVAKRELEMSDGEMMAALQGYEERRDAEAREAFAAMAKANQQAGDDFRASFAKDDDVVTLASGLLYKVIEPGSGEIPTATDTVTFHYRGTLIDGSEIDSSYSRDEPVTIQADEVMPGWREALTQMPVGSKWQVVLPPELAFGDQGAGPIEPGTTMIFEIELVSVG